MRAKLGTAALAMLVCAGAAAQSITVTRPWHTDQWAKGSSYTITWTTQGQVGSSFAVTLRDVGDTTDVLTIAAQASGGSQLWTVPLSLTPANYKVRVKSGNVIGTSPSFAITGGAATPVKVTSPNGGESWQSGASKQITWTPGSAAGTVKVELYRNGTAPANKIGVIAPSVAAAAGTYAWTVGGYQGGTAPAGAGYKVMVVPSDAALQDASDNAFTIAAAPAVTPTPTTPVPSTPVKVTSPNGGESWQAGASKSITWTPGSATGTARIELYRNGTAPANKIGVIASSFSVTAGSYPWTVGAYQGGTAPVGDGYRIVILPSNAALQDASDNPFGIAIGLAGVGFRPDLGRVAVPTATFSPLQAGLPKTSSLSVALKEYVENATYNNDWGWYMKYIPNSSPPVSATSNDGIFGPGFSCYHQACVGYGYHSFVWPGTSKTDWLVIAARSGVFFFMDNYRPMAARFFSATMHLHQVTIGTSHDSSASCAAMYSVITGPWAGWNSTPIKDTRTLDTTKTEYDVDVTGPVKEWLTGNPKANGFLLSSREVLSGEQPMACGSTYDVTLTLKFTEQ